MTDDWLFQRYERRIYLNGVWRGALTALLIETSIIVGAVWHGWL